MGKTHECKMYSVSSLMVTNYAFMVGDSPESQKNTLGTSYISFCHTLGTVLMHKHPNGAGGLDSGQFSTKLQDADAKPWVWKEWFSTKHQSTDAKSWVWKEWFSTKCKDTDANFLG